jgi:hypothetical protein
LVCARISRRAMRAISCFKTEPRFGIAVAFGQVRGYAKFSSVTARNDLLDKQP